MASDSITQDPVKIAAKNFKIVIIKFQIIADITAIFHFGEASLIYMVLKIKT